MDKLKYNILALFHLRFRHPNDWDSVHSYKDLTTLYACKHCYKTIEQSPGYIKRVNNHTCHSLDIHRNGYISKEDIAINKQMWGKIKKELGTL